MHEAKLHEKNIFITLTYSDDNIRWSARTGEQTLFKRDLQLFLKRLRKHFEPTKIRFFACGEYGDTTARPHYHAILFGCDFDDKVLYKVLDVGCLYTSESLTKLWSLGHVVIADVTFDTCAYVARYVLKKQNGELGKEKYEGIQPEFVNMSRRPGIGKEFYDRYKSDMYPYDEVVILDRDKTRVLRPPRYYDKLYDIDEPETLAAIKSKRMEKAKRKEQEIYTPGRLEAKEKFKLSQTKDLKRSVE